MFTSVPLVTNIAESEQLSWDTAAGWSAEAIEGYAKVEEENLLRTVVDFLNTSLAKCKKLSFQKFLRRRKGK